MHFKYKYFYFIIDFIIFILYRIDINYSEQLLYYYHFFFGLVLVTGALVVGVILSAILL